MAYCSCTFTTTTATRQNQASKGSTSVITVCGVFALQALSPPYAAYSLHEFSGALIKAARQDFSPVSKSSRLDRPPRITV
jgi:hypothetical protein